MVIQLEYQLLCYFVRNLTIMNVSRIEIDSLTPWGWISTIYFKYQRVDISIIIVQIIIAQDVVAPMVVYNLQGLISRHESEHIF